MKKETILLYLDQQISQQLGDYEIAIDWHKRESTIEVIFRLFAENPSNERIDDVAGVISEEEIIEFEDSILFYDPQKATINQSDFLTTIPYEGKKGIKKSVLDSLIVYLKNILINGQKALIEFLSDNQQEIFELAWSEVEFQAIVTAYPSEHDKYIAYPSY